MQHSFPCGDLALDFVGTLQARRAVQPREMLARAADLDAWLRESGMIEAGPLSSVSDLSDAVELREAVYALVHAKLTDEAFGEQALEAVNAAAREPAAAAQLSSEGRRVEATVSQALSSLARHAIDILGGPDAPFLKECARPECTQVYIDHSRGSRREWCAMATCGNLMKAAAYRARQRDPQSAAAARA